VRAASGLMGGRSSGILTFRWLRQVTVAPVFEDMGRTNGGLQGETGLMPRDTFCERRNSREQEGQ
jgi:hypothetical protein